MSSADSQRDLTINTILNKYVHLEIHPENDYLSNKCSTFALEPSLGIENRGALNLCRLDVLFYGI
jgi:hypothetical protein